VVPRRRGGSPRRRARAAHRPAHDTTRRRNARAVVVPGATAASERVVAPLLIARGSWRCTPRLGMWAAEVGLGSVARCGGLCVRSTRLWALNTRCGGAHNGFTCGRVSLPLMRRFASEGAENKREGVLRTNPLISKTYLTPIKRAFGHFSMSFVELSPPALSRSAPPCATRQLIT
jgi:hypothetical protein